MPRPKWNHAYEVAFSIETDTSPEEGVSDAELIAGLEARLAEFRANPGLAQDAKYPLIKGEWCRKRAVRRSIATRPPATCDCFRRKQLGREQWLNRTGLRKTA